MKKLLIILALLLVATPVYADGQEVVRTPLNRIVATGENYTPFNNVAEIKQFVFESKFSYRAWGEGTYDCINYDDGVYYGFALDFCEYAQNEGRLFIPCAVYNKGEPDSHVLTITFIGNKVYSVDPYYMFGDVSLIDYVD